MICTDVIAGGFEGTDVGGFGERALSTRDLQRFEILGICEVLHLD